MSKKSFIICDIDGTVANLHHRLHYIKNKPKNWDAFFASVGDDEPINETIRIINALKDAGFDIVMVSGRSDITRAETEAWLDKHGIKYDALYMRRSRDRRPDYIVKREILYKKIIPNHGHPYMVFDDRKQVIDMWLEEGYYVIDVSQGKGDF